MLRAESVTFQSVQCGSGGEQSVCNCLCVTARSDYTNGSLECRVRLRSQEVVARDQVKGNTAVKS